MRFSLRIILVISFLFILLSSCTLLSTPKDPNVITDWFTIHEVGTKYSMERLYLDYHNGELTDADTILYDVTISEVTEDSNNIYVEFDIGGYYSELGSYYYIIDKKEGRLINCGDKTYDEEYDFVFLTTPIEIGTSWYEDKYKISAIDESKILEAGEFSDLIAVKSHVTFKVTSHYDYTYWYSPSTGRVVYSEYILISNEGSDEFKDVAIDQLINIDY